MSADPAPEVVLTHKKNVRKAHRASATRLMNQAERVLTTSPVDTDGLAVAQTGLTTKLTKLESLDSEILELTPEDQMEDEVGKADEYSERIQHMLLRIRKALGATRRVSFSPILPRVRSTDPDPTDPPPSTDPDPTDPDPPPSTDPDPTDPDPPPSTDPDPTDPDPPPSTVPEPTDPTDPSTSSIHHSGSPSATTPLTWSDLQEHLTHGAAHHGGRVRLPKISLPHFKGNPVYWTAFWDSYESAIHLNSSLSDVDKFNYLKSLLERSAYDAIAGLTLSSANYHEAIDILKRRFGNRQMIISRHMDILLNLAPVTGDHDIRGLRRLYNDVETNVRGLRALGVGHEAYGAMLTSVLLTKLPPELRLIVNRRAPLKDLNLEGLQEILEEELNARERSFDGRVSRRSHDNSRSTHSFATLLSETREPLEKLRCCYCQQSHDSGECDTVKDVGARLQSLKTSGRCFNCLMKGHLVRTCRARSQCQLCKQRHHPSICDKQGTFTRKSPTQAENTTVTVSTLNPDTIPYVPTSGKAVLLQTAQAVIYNPRNLKRCVKLRMLLDGGSQRSYMTERAVKKLNLTPDGEHQLSIAAFGTTRGSPQVCSIVSVGVTVKKYPNVMLSCFVVPLICEPLISQPVSLCTRQYPHFADLELADSAGPKSELAVDMLVGADHYWDLVTGAIAKGAGGLTAIHTKLGWVMSGPVGIESPNSQSTSLLTTHVLSVDTTADSLNDSLQTFWDLESLGIQHEEGSTEEKTISDIEFRDGRYEVSLPWKQSHRSLPDNYELSRGRLCRLLKRLRRSPVLLRDYDNIIQEQILSGIVEDTPSNDTCPAHLHYLPHHPVVRTDKDTTKIRIVYDASAKQNGDPSLNDCLLTGPKFNQRILDILVRFRSYSIALVADIEKAFLMVSVVERDRDALRFLWVRDIQDEEFTIRPLRFKRVVFGVCSSPYLLNSTIRHHLQQHLNSHPELLQKLTDSFYVDDVITGAPTEEEAFHLYSESKRVLKHGAFNLRKFRTNSVRLQQRIEAAEGRSRDDPPIPLTQGLEETYSDVTLGKPHSSESATVKVLGVIWDPERDCLLFDMTDVAEEALTTDLTKRNVVRIIGRMYDPLGFLAPIIIRFKRLFQSMCGKGIEWDEGLPEPVKGEWKTLIEDLRHSQPVSIPRSYIQEGRWNVHSSSLTGFCDASMTAYAAVVYLVVRTEIRVHTQFVICKTRVAPMQSITIPRLELLSALLLARLIVTVSRSLTSVIPCHELKCYTDSMVALHWIRGLDKEWRQFVANRVNEIREKTPPSCWSHCPGVSNPADLPTRGMGIDELRVSRLWRFGPDWLQSDVVLEDKGESTQIPEECSLEMKTSHKKVHNLVTVEGSHTQ